MIYVVEQVGGFAYERDVNRQTVGLQNSVIEANNVETDDAIGFNDVIDERFGVVLRVEQEFILFDKTLMGMK